MIDFLVQLAQILSCVGSIIAIYISVQTVYSQNRIALFEKKYEIYSQLCRIIDVGRVTKEAYDEKKTIITADEAWRAILSRMNWVDGTLGEIKSQRVSSEVIISQYKFLFNDIDFNQINEPMDKLLDTFRKYVNETYHKQGSDGYMWKFEVVDEDDNIDHEEDESSGNTDTNNSDTDRTLQAWIQDFFDACTSEEIKALQLQMEESLDLTPPMPFKVILKKAGKFLDDVIDLLFPI